MDDSIQSASRRGWLAAAGVAGIAFVAHAAAQSTRPSTGPATSPAKSPSTRPDSGMVPVNTSGVVETVNRVAMLADLREWDALRLLFGREVAVDYESLTGQPAAQVLADELVQSWATTLSAYDATHHLVGSHVVLPDETGDARCLCAVTATHVRRVSADADYRRNFEWTIGGRYDYHLRPSGRSTSGYVVSAVRFTYNWERGDRHLGQRNFGD